MTRRIVIDLYDHTSDEEITEIVNSMRGIGLDDVRVERSTIEIDALALLDAERERYVRSREGKSDFEPLSNVENQMAGVMHFLLDRLSKAGHDRAALSDSHGFGRIVREAEAR